MIDINDFCDRAERQLLARHTSGDDETDDEYTVDDAKLDRWETDRNDPEED